MSITILNGVLTPEELAQVREGFARLTFEDGVKTGGAFSRGIKENVQSIPDDPAAKALGQIVSNAVSRHPMFMAAAMPWRMSQVVFSRYAVGKGYGAHIDEAWYNRADGTFRRDLSFTLFLADLDTYDGGALKADWGGMSPSIRLAPGDAVLYPATTIHEVTPITRGERHTAIGWVQSKIKLAEHRDILKDLRFARDSVRQRGGPEMLVLSKTLENLTRLWSEV
jgi:PKHD-type hydroxylase